MHVGDNMKNTWMQRSSVLAMAVVYATFTTVQTAKAQNIDLTTYANSGGCCFGPSTGYTAMGQTITIGANQTRLTDFSFILNPHNGGTNFNVTGNVALWDAANSKIGATLFTSSPVNYPAGNAYDDGSAVDFTFGSNLTLTQGNQYAFFLSSYGSTGFGDTVLSSSNQNPYTDGQFIFNSGNPSSNSWETWLNNIDARLKVNFAPPPPPLVTLGLSNSAFTPNDGYANYNADINNPLPLRGQEFVVPASNGKLTQFKFNLDWRLSTGTPTTDALEARIYQFDRSSNRLLGNSLFTTTIGPSQNYVSGWDVATIDIPNGGLNLTPGGNYAAVLYQPSGTSGTPLVAYKNSVIDDSKAFFQYYQSGGSGSDDIPNLSAVNYITSWGNPIYDYEFQAQFGSLVAQLADISGLTPKLASELGLNYNPAFTGGSLRLDQAGQTFNQNFTLAGSGNAIDIGGNSNTFSGKFQNAVNGTPINLELKNSGSGGSITFANDIGESGNSVGTITNSTNWNLSAGADVFANGINNSGQFVIANGATVTDDLNNTGYLFNSGTYNANLTNDGVTAQIWNDTTGVWNGDVLSNTNDASIFNFGQWNGNANNSATIENNVAGTWTGNITNNLGGLINNLGILAGTVTNAGTVDNQSGGSITGLVTNTGAFHNLAGSSISGGLTQSSGTSTNAGVISNASGTGVSLSGGTFTNGSGGILNNGLELTGGSFANLNGAIINGGLIYSSTATSNNAGTLNGGAIINSGRLNNTKDLNGAVVLNSGANLVNYSTGVVTGNLTNNSGASVTNEGAINGDVNNSGTLTNNLGATITGTFNQNDGTLTNNGTISGDVVFAGGTITNSGTMDSPLSSAITANGGSLITNNATGVIGTYANAIHGIFSTSAVSIDNSGSISAGANSDAKAIATVDGTIINRAGGTINGESAGVYNTGTLDLTNSGTINGNLYHGVYSAGDATIVNNNTITGGINAIYSLGSLNLKNIGSLGSLGDVAISNSAGSSVTNAGNIISSLNSAVVVGRASTVTNAIGGVLTGGSSNVWGAGVQMAGESGTVNNYGLMNGTAGGIISNQNLGTGGPGGVLNINLFAGSTTGNINLINNSGSANITLYNGLGTTNTGLTDGFGTQLQNAGTLAGAVFGNIYGNSSANQSLYLAGTGNGTAALGAIGNLDVGKIFNLTEINKTGTGIWRLTGNSVTPGMTINAGNGSPSGVLQFNATGLAGDINVNGAVIQALASGAFGSGTIHMIDPTIQFSANGTYSNNISLEVLDGQVATDPATFLVDPSIVAYLSGEITQSSAFGVDPNQDFVKTGSGTLVLQNTNNSWTGVTKVLAGRLAGQTDTISGSSISNNGVVEINQIAGGTLNQAVSGTGYIEVNSLADGSAINFAGNITQNLNNNSMGDIILSGAANNSSVVSQVAGSSVTLANGAANNVGAANAFRIADGVTFENYGTATSNGDNVVYAQNGGTINNYESGVIRADGAGHAIFGDGVNAVNIYNYGNISATAGNTSAIELSSTGANYVYNEGSISGDIGIAFNAGGTLVNTSTGSITGTTTGILVNNAAVDLTLNGTLVGGTDAIKMVGNFNNSISLNSGSNTSGNITFDSGDDTFVIDTGAIFTGNVAGGAGVDSYELTGTGTNTINAGSFSNFESRSKTGTGTWTLTGTDGVTADFNLLEGTLVLSGGSAMNNAANVITSTGSTLQLASNEAIGGLSGSGNVDLQNYLLVVGANNSDQSFSGTISGAGGSLNKIGSGVFNLS